jgi:hypothetical protein
LYGKVASKLDLVLLKVKNLKAIVYGSAFT